MSRRDLDHSEHTMQFGEFRPSISMFSCKIQWVPRLFNRDHVMQIVIGRIALVGRYLLLSTSQVHRRYGTILWAPLQIFRIFSKQPQGSGLK